MCLRYDKDKTEYFKKELDIFGTTFVYKLVKVYYDNFTVEKDKVKLKSIFRDNKIPKEKQWLISNRKSTKLTDYEQEYKQIDLGIHVFTSYTETMDFLNKEEISNVLVYVCKVSKEDFVACGNFQSYNSAVFTKVMLDPENIAFCNITSTNLIEKLLQ